MKLFLLGTVLLFSGCTANQTTTTERQAVVLNLYVTEQNRLLINGAEAEPEAAPSAVASFVREQPGGTVRFCSSRQALYRTYTDVLADVRAGFGAERDRRAQESHGRPFAELGAEEQESVREAVPLRIDVSSCGEEDSTS